MPLGLSIAFFVLGCFVIPFRKIPGVVLVLLGVLVLYLSSISPVAKWFMHQLERDYPPVAVEVLPEVDAIVLLGGGIVNPASPRLEPELDAHGDRLGYAARLYKAGKAPVIVVSGGNVFDEPGMLSNAEYSAQLLERWGVPRSDMMLESDSRNTYENARETARLLPATQTTILLVTSAFHMRRAIPLFEAQGFSVVHASTDIQFTSFSGPGIIKWLPEVYHLDLTTKAIKEFIGFQVYRWQGWL